MELVGELSQVKTLTGTLSNTCLRGYSAYDIAVQNGFEGTEEEWLNNTANKSIAVNGDVIAPVDGVINITAEPGTASGSIAINGKNVSMKGIGSAAFTDASAYEKAGAAAAVLGTPQDSEFTNTVYGTMAKAQHNVERIQTLTENVNINYATKNELEALRQELLELINSK